MKRQSDHPPLTSWIGALCIALVVRFLYLWYGQVRQLPSFVHNNPHFLLAEYWLGWAPHIRDIDIQSVGPGFASLCALLFKISGSPNILLIRIVNVLLSSITCFLTGYWAYHVAGSSVSRLTSYWTALSPSLIFLSAQLESESLFIFMQMALFSWLIYAQDLPLYRVAGLGFFAGLMSLVRPIFIIYLPVFLLAFLWLLKGKAQRRRCLAMLLLGWMLPIVCWTWINWVHYHAFVPLTVQGGQTLYLGLVPSPNEPERLLRAEEKEMGRLGIKKWIDQDNYLLKKSIVYIRNHPVRYIETRIIKLFQYWRPWPYAPYSGLARVSLGIYYSLLFSLSAIGVWRSRDKYLSLLPIYAFFVCFSVAFSIFYSCLRYRAPLDPFLCFFASVGFLRLREIWS